MHPTRRVMEWPSALRALKRCSKMITRFLAMILLATGSMVAGEHGEITMSVPYVAECGDLRATIANHSENEIQIHPSHCGVEIAVGDRTATLAAKDPQIASLISLKIRSGEARDFSFERIPGLADLDGRLRLVVHAVSTDPLESTTVKSEWFEISDLESSPKAKPGMSPRGGPNGSPP
jgi:hypothetical protein